MVRSRQTQERMGAVGRRGRRRPGFTLMEALVALIIFTILTFAMSLALSAALQAQSVSERRQAENGDVRAVFDTLTRDLQGAYASLHNPASVFIAGGGSGGGPGSSQMGSTGLLTLTALTYHIQAASLAAQETPGAQPDAATAASSMQPQSDVAMIQYNVDPQSGLLTRSVSSIPSPQALMQTPPRPQIALAEHVQDLKLSYWDPIAQSWRDYWDYEQQNQTQAQSGTGQNGAAGNAANQPSNATTGDTILPAAVQVTLVLRKEDGSLATYMTEIPVLAPQPATDPSTFTPNNNAVNQGTNGTGTPNTGGTTTPGG